MNTLPIYQADAFTNRLFGGNPAAIVPLESWIDDHLMQQIAMENNLAETAFIVKRQHDYHIRWFTPLVEIDLCGHATLAAAYIITRFLGYTSPVVRFHSKSGELLVTRKDHLLELNFPARMPDMVTDYPEQLLQGLAISNPVAIYKSRDYVVELNTQEEVEKCTPDFAVLGKIPVTGIMITAPGRHCDFVSRFFAPASGINEDPVTGSAHSTLIPFWAAKLHKKELHAFQLSARKGELWCSLLPEDRVLMAGECVFYMKGEIVNLPVGRW
ncbi:MAG: PhzF family phenazine biosynthesis protein [Bacteroidetes bacterium]|nr:PhzF family phenazine biosynthesis protein [Bacteroidota bacterium]